MSLHNKALPCRHSEISHAHTNVFMFTRQIFVLPFESLFSIDVWGNSVRKQNSPLSELNNHIQRESKQGKWVFHEKIINWNKIILSIQLSST